MFMYILYIKYRRICYLWCLYLILNQYFMCHSTALESLLIIICSIFTIKNMLKRSFSKKQSLNKMACTRYKIPVICSVVVHRLVYTNISIYVIRYGSCPCVVLWCAMSGLTC